ncbi:MAG: twin-arginine translocase subunit TatC [Phycisphaerales bacterium]|nr:twin-arginine translocase subunit TatC [Phycisphaerales bacterium]
MRRTSNPSEHTMSFGDHLEELRRSVFWAIGGVFPIFFIALYYSRNLVQLIIAPVREALHDAHLSTGLVSTGVFETFNASMQMALIATIILGSPWILWQVWKFIAPGLHDYERRFVYILLPLSALLTTIGIAFFYFLVLPIILAFMINWSVMGDLNKQPTAPLPQGIVLPTIPILDTNPENPPLGSMWINKLDQRLYFGVPSADGRSVVAYGTDLGPSAAISPSYRVAEYLGTLVAMALSFAAAFQTPVVVLMLGWVGIIDTKFLAKFRRHAVLASLVLGALLTPGDVISFVMVVIPMYLLYELGGILLRILPAHRVARGFLAKAKPRDDDDSPDDDMSEDPPRGRAALPPPAEIQSRNGEH